MARKVIIKPREPSQKSPIGDRQRGDRQDGRWRAHADGFTLLEILIALAILGIGLTVLLAAFSQGLARGRNDQVEATARSFAISLLSQALSEPDVTIGETAGRSSGLVWHVRIEPYGTADDQVAWHGRAGEVSVTVSWRQPGRSREITLKSLRLLRGEES